MRRKDSALIARAIREARINDSAPIDTPSKSAIVRRLVMLLSADDPTFNPETFVQSCGLPFSSTFAVAETSDHPNRYEVTR